MFDAKVFKLGNSLVLTLPVAIRKHIEAERGDHVGFVIRPDKRVEIVALKNVNR